MQSEMSATPQPTDISNAVIKQFHPQQNNNNNNTLQPNDDNNTTNNTTNNNNSVPNLSDIGPIVDMPRPPPKMKTIQSEISNGGLADDEISSPGSASDNDTVTNDSSGIIKIKSIKTLTPTPHTPSQRNTVPRTSQIIRPATVEQLQSSSPSTNSPNSQTNGSGNGIAAGNNANSGVGRINGINKSMSSSKINITPLPKKPGKRRQSWADIAIEKIDSYPSTDINTNEFKMIKPINQQQGVDNMIKEYRKSLGQSELKDTLEELRKEFDPLASSGEDEETKDRQTNSDDDNDANIVDVQEQSLTSSNKEEDEDSFLSDDDFRVMQAKYIQ